MGAALFHADRLTEERMDRRDAVNCPFSQFCGRAPPPPKKALHFARTVNLFCLYYSYNKQRLFT